MVERLLQSDLSVGEWSRNNGISKPTMYNWLSQFAKSEPELFGGKQNIADTDKRNWLQITRKNMADVSALAIREPAGVLIIDTIGETALTPKPQRDCALPSSSIQVVINSVHVAIAAGTDQTDIASVLKVVASL
jgi:transposase-like protein